MKKSVQLSDRGYDIKPDKGGIGISRKFTKKLGAATLEITHSQINGIAATNVTIPAAGAILLEQCIKESGGNRKDIWSSKKGIEFGLKPIKDEDDEVTAIEQAVLRLDEVLEPLTNERGQQIVREVAQAQQVVEALAPIKDSNPYKPVDYVNGLQTKIDAVIDWVIKQTPIIGTINALVKDNS